MVEFIQISGFRANSYLRTSVSEVIEADKADKSVEHEVHDLSFQTNSLFLFPMHPFIIPWNYEAKLAYSLYKPFVTCFSLISVAICPTIGN